MSDQKLQFQPAEIAPWGPNSQPWPRQKLKLSLHRSEKPARRATLRTPLGNEFDALILEGKGDSMKIKGILGVALLAISLTGCGASKYLEQPASNEPWGPLPQQYDDATRLKKMLSHADESPRVDAVAMAK